RGHPQLLRPSATAMGPLITLATILQLTSPNGAIGFDVSGTADGQLIYSVALDRHPVVAPSPLGISVDGRRLTSATTTGPIERYDVDEQYGWWGVHATATARCRGARIPLQSMTLDVRACDDGVGLRYIVPGDVSALRVPDEATVFRVPATATVWWHDFEGHYEGIHTRSAASAI